MRRLILEEWVSLDGYAEDGEGKLDFFPPTETDRFSDRDQLRFLDGVFPDRRGCAHLRRVDVRTYDTGVVFVHYEPRRDGEAVRVRAMARRGRRR
jgi:hypothetical protein